MKIIINSYKNKYLSPAMYFEGKCILNKCKNKEYDLMVALDLEVEYMTIILNHEQIHLLICKMFHTTWTKDKLIHLQDVCALVGF